MERIMQGLGVLFVVALMAVGAIDLIRRLSLSSGLSPFNPTVKTQGF